MAVQIDSPIKLSVICKWSAVWANIRLAFHPITPFLGADDYTEKRYSGVVYVEGVPFGTTAYGLHQGAESWFV